MSHTGPVSTEAAEEHSRGNIVMKHNHKELEGSLRVRSGQQLLPGIPDDITINLVAPKLPWTAFHKLSAVSFGWQQAIWSHQIYEARVRSQSTQTLVLMNHRFDNDVWALSLYSLSDGSFHHLPQYPGTGTDPTGELHSGSECISLAGKVYVLGGCSDSATNDGHVYLASAAVYVFDIAGKRTWQKCASMQHPRFDFGCGVINEKIYVFGGRNSENHAVCGYEVYDPKSDAWSLITPTKYFGFRQHVVTMGEELFVYNGEVFDPDYLERINNPDYEGFRPCIPPVDIQGEYYAEVYDPLNDRWRIVDHSWPGFVAEAMLMVEGKLHKLTTCGIEVYDVSANSSKLSRTISFADIGQARFPALAWFLSAVATGSELLAVVHWIEGDGQRPIIEDQGVRVRIRLMRSEGFGGQNRVVWHDTKCPLLSTANGTRNFLRAIQL